MVVLAIVEDNTFWSSHLAHKIEEWNNQRYNLEICIYATGREFLNALSLGKVFDLIFMDIMLGTGEDDGIQILQKAKALVCNAQSVIISSFLEFEYAQAACALGVKAYMVKPLDNDVLFNFLEDFFCLKQITLKRGADKVILSLSHITYLQKDGGNVLIHTTSKGIFSIKSTIKKFDTVLPYYFAQCDRATIANIQYIDHYLIGGNIVLTTGDVLRCGETFVESFEAAYRKYVVDYCFLNKQKL